MNVRHLAGLAVTLAAGCAVGYGWHALGSGGRTAVSAEAEAPGRPAARIADEGEAASLRALRARVRELESQLAARVLEGSNAVASADASRADEPPRQEAWKDRMERLQREDPERYATITNRMEQWRVRQAERRVAQMDFLAGVDTSRMGAKAKQVHADFQEAIVRKDEIETRLHDPNLTDDQRRALWDEMRQVNDMMRQLGNQERSNLFAETAKALGFKGQDVRDITATMRDIVEATDNGWGGPHHHRGGGRGPGGGGQNAR